MFRRILMIWGLSFLAAAFFGGWIHASGTYPEIRRIELKSTDQTQILIDYQVGASVSGSNGGVLYALIQRIVILAPAGTELQDAWITIDGDTLSSIRLVCRSRACGSVGSPAYPRELIFLENSSQTGRRVRIPRLRASVTRLDRGAAHAVTLQDPVTGDGDFGLMF